MLSLDAEDAEEFKKGPEAVAEGAASKRTTYPVFSSAFIRVQPHSAVK